MPQFEGVTTKRPRDECGVFALQGHRDSYTAAQVAYLGLLALQHRGQESAGMAAAGSAGIYCRKGMGLVTQVFNSDDSIEYPANTILGHVRYSTAGISNVNNAQPLVARSSRGTSIALAHNGNLFNNASLKQALLEDGHIFHTTTDTETILAYLFRYRHRGLAEAVRKVMAVTEGAYAAVVMDAEERLAAFRDPHGFRPLVMGRLNEAVIFSSETCALDAVGADFIREVEPGETVLVERGKMESFTSHPPLDESFCIFEFIYFARPDSIIHGKNVHLVRKAAGARLAQHISVDLDMVIPAPDSGVSAAIGMAEAAGLPLEWAVYRNPYQGRTFIEPTEAGRVQSARLKYNPVSCLVRDKKVAVVDDSLVRGTTARKLTALLRGAGAREVHFFISAPPYTNPCYYGIDIPVSSELAAAAKDASALAEAVDADSITFAAVEDLYAAVGHHNSGYCTACLTGNYPTSRQLK